MPTPHPPNTYTLSLHDALPISKNILMIGPTGVGKTEISRRLARLAGAPFLKVEATKFTEVGYVGDRKSTRLNSSHLGISYAVFCFKKKRKIDVHVGGVCATLIY